MLKEQTDVFFEQTDKTKKKHYIETIGVKRATNGHIRHRKK